MTKTITTSFEVPDSNKPVWISLDDTDGIKAGATMRIGFDYYTITVVSPGSMIGISAVKAPTIIPAGLECWIVDVNVSTGDQSENERKGNFV